MLCQPYESHTLEQASCAHELIAAIPKLLLVVSSLNHPENSAYLEEPEAFLAFLKYLLKVT